MADDPTIRRIVLSDVHFGTPESSINDDRLRGALIGYMASRAPWEEIVLAGDLLDVNLSTLTLAIEGGRMEGSNVPLSGFRKFLEELDAAMRRQSPDKGLEELARRWIYLPGNHDYKIWDMLSSKVVCEDVIASGQPMGSVPTPLMSHKWAGDEAFLAGLFRPYGVADRVVIAYPNHEISFGGGRDMLVVAHGHYLDPKQTGFNNLSDHLPAGAAAPVADDARRHIFIETAQYQTAANAVSFTKFWRELANAAVGPDSLGNKVRKLFSRIAGWLLKLFSPIEATRGRQLSPNLLANIECYLERFCGYARPPRWFVFGHTHRQESGRTDRLGVEVYNAGSCYLDRGMPITFAEIATGAGDAPVVSLMCVDRNARVTAAR